MIARRYAKTLSTQASWGAQKHSRLHLKGRASICDHEALSLHERSAPVGLWMCGDRARYLIAVE